MTAIDGLKPAFLATPASNCPIPKVVASLTAPQVSHMRKGDNRRAVVVVGAGEIGVAALDAVDKSLLHQKVQSTIHRHRRRAPFVADEHVHDLVGTDRLVAGCHRLEDEAAQCCEPFPSLGTGRFSVRDRIRAAAAVVAMRLRAASSSAAGVSGTGVPASAFELVPLATKRAASALGGRPRPRSASGPPAW